MMTKPNPLNLILNFHEYTDDDLRNAVVNLMKRYHRQGENSALERVRQIQREQYRRQQC